MKHVLFVFGILWINACGQGGASLSSTGVSGSTARFAVVGEYLYVLNRLEKSVDPEASNENEVLFSAEGIDTFSLLNPEVPAFINRLELRLRPETLHPAGTNLFVGTTSGMLIVSLEDPPRPKALSFSSHFISRDPVVVSGNRAYVTLRSSETSEFLRSGLNDLKIFNIEDLLQPVQLSVFPMTSPWGLGVQSGKAYVCDGSSGLRVLSVTDPLAVSELTTFDTDICFDVITTPTLLISTGATGINQYEIDENADVPLLISTIALEQPM